MNAVPLFGEAVYFKMCLNIAGFMNHFAKFGRFLFSLSFSNHFIYLNFLFNACGC